MKKSTLFWILSFLLGAGGASAVTIPIAVNYSIQATDLQEQINNLQEEINNLQEEKKLTLQERQQLEIVSFMESSVFKKVKEVYSRIHTKEEASALLQEVRDFFKEAVPTIDASSTMGFDAEPLWYDFTLKVSTRLETVDLISIRTEFENGSVKEFRISAKSVEELKDWWGL